jgi:flavin reductase (DIM6/NTAB) family NADH-FMN oxidoreductase RutF
MDKTAAAALFAWLDREVWLITACAGDRRGALIATFVSEASLVKEMPRFLVGIAQHHHTWSLIEESRAFAAHLLGQDNLDWVWRFGLRSGWEHDKFAGLTWETAATGSPIFAAAIGWMDCRVEAGFDTGDRTVYLGEVVEARIAHSGPPLRIKQVLESATPEQRAELKRLIEQDSRLDALAIEEWRRQRGRT